MTAKPFLKWAGGKSQLLPLIRGKYPGDLDSGDFKYCEPFVGGGAVLFDLLSRYSFQDVLINDINEELINTYQQVRSNVDDLIVILSQLQDDYLSLDMLMRKDFYYQKRERFNSLTVGANQAESLEKAALLIFLNRTCFNGLFRVNSKGHFNVPAGSYVNPIICDAENLYLASQALADVKMMNSDFRACEAFIGSDTFVYIDPPYRPLSETSSFTSYAKTNFDDNEQVALGQFVDIISNKGAKVLLSNSDPKNIDVEDEFFDDLYENYYISRIPAKRMINSNAKRRGEISELLVSNY